jgi:calcium-dependent protein kinase
MFVISSSTQTNELTAWRNYLATVLNQRGFHPLFRAVKKIGKDNFATVYLVTKLENEKKYAVKAFSKASIYS